METSIDLTSFLFGYESRLFTGLRCLGFKFVRHTGPPHALTLLAQGKLWAWFSRSSEMFVDCVGQLRSSF